MTAPAFVGEYWADVAIEIYLPSGPAGGSAALNGPDNSATLSLREKKAEKQ